MSGTSIGMVELAHVKAQFLKRRFRQSMPLPRDRREPDTFGVPRYNTRTLAVMSGKGVGEMNQNR